MMASAPHMMDHAAPMPPPQRSGAAANDARYHAYRQRLETYFDKTAAKAWTDLTSDAPVSRIRATVRAGRDAMRSTLIEWLPVNLHGRRVLDAGCGTGALAVEAARRGAHVVAIDVSAALIEVARTRRPTDLRGGSIDFHVGDMLNPDLGAFDHVVAMDSLIHYPADDIAAVLAALAPRVRGSMVFTHAPRTTMLLAMQAAGKLFPRGDRSPAIIPVDEQRLLRSIGAHEAMTAWRRGREHLVSTSFYKSRAMELIRG